MLKSSRPDDPEDRARFIQEQLDARGSALGIQRLEAAVSLLGLTIRAVDLAGVDTATLRSVLESMKQRLRAAQDRAGGNIAPRARPAQQKEWSREGPRHRFQLFIDESGGTRLNLTPDGRYFAVGGLLVSEAAYGKIEREWSAWKSEWVGRESATMHAKQLTRKRIGYYANRSGSPEEALRSLNDLVAGFDCTLFVMAIDKVAFQEQYLREPVDSFLPGSHYAICLDFLLERVVYCLLALDDAHAHVTAEGRNRYEDAKIQHEYQRLQVEGTAFQAGTWFRYQLGPHITFAGKGENIAGLQLVDVLLKAVVDKLADPTADPLRWDVARDKLYDGGKGKVRGWGLKIFPAVDERTDALLEASKKTEDAPSGRPPPTEQSSTVSEQSMP